jgi:hypothetical protein
MGDAQRLWERDQRDPVRAEISRCMREQREREAAGKTGTKVYKATQQKIDAWISDNLKRKRERHKQRKLATGLLSGVARKLRRTETESSDETQGG